MYLDTLCQFPDRILTDLTARVIIRWMNLRHGNAAELPRSCLGFLCGLLFFLVSHVRYIILKLFYHITAIGIDG